MPGTYMSAPCIITLFYFASSFFCASFFATPAFIISHELLIMIGSNIQSIAGSMHITTIILIIAPLERRLHIALIISIAEYAVTPNVAAKKQKPLVSIDFIEVSCAILIASFLLHPFTVRSLWYLFVISIA